MITAFVGREAELTRVDAACAAACDPRATGAFQCVLVTGDPGIGRTRFAHAARERHAPSMVGLWARARGGSARVPLGAWTEAVDRLLRAEDPDAAAARRNGPAGPDDLHALLCDLTASRPVLVVLDDVDQADAASWDLLHRLAERQDAAGLIVIATARSGSLERQAAAMRVLCDLEQQGVLHRIVLEPLSDEELDRLADDALDAPLEPRRRRRLLDRSRGIPSLAVGFLDALRHDGRALEGPVPERVAAAVRARAAALDPVARDVLERLAVGGGRLDLEVLCRAGDLSLGAVSSALGALVDARLVGEDAARGRRAYEIAPPLVAEVVRDDTGAARRTVIHRELGRSLVRAGRLAEAAHHLARAADSNDDESVDILVQALELVERRGAYADGLKLLGVLGDVVPAGAARWSGIADSLHNWMGDHRVDADAGAAAAALIKIDALPAERLDDHQRANVQARLVTLFAFGTGELDRAAGAARRAIRLFERSGTRSEVLLARLELAYVQALDGAVPASVDEIARIVASAEETRDEAVLEPALGAYALMLFLAGRFADADATYTRAVGLAVRDRSERAVHHRLRQGWALGYGGRMTEALEAFEDAKAMDPLWRDSSVLEIEACVRWLAGDLRGALECADGCEPQAWTFRRGLALSVEAMAAAETDDLSRARAAIARAREVYGQRQWFYATDVFQHAEGLLAWREGRTDDAHAALTLAGSHLLRMGAPVLAAPVLVDLAELSAETGAAADAFGAAEDLRRVAGVSDSTFIAMAAQLAEAWALRSQGVLAPAAEAADAAVRLLAPSGYRVLYGRALVAAGRTRPDDPEAGVELLREAVDVFHAAGAAWRRDRALQELRELGRNGRRAAAVALGTDALTGREWEIARLAVQRLSAQAIADRLTLSRRTVESHLASVYAKLGVHSREQLIDVLASRSAPR